MIGNAKNILHFLHLMLNRLPASQLQTQLLLRTCT